jgi:hypothetical protein
MNEDDHDISNFNRGEVPEIDGDVSESARNIGEEGTLNGNSLLFGHREVLEEDTSQAKSRKVRVSDEQRDSPMEFPSRKQKGMKTVTLSPIVGFDKEVGSSGSSKSPSPLVSFHPHITTPSSSLSPLPPQSSSPSFSSPEFPLKEEETQTSHWSRVDYSDTHFSTLPTAPSPLSPSEEASILLADFISEIGMTVKPSVPMLTLPKHPPRISPPSSPLHSYLVAETSPRSLIASHRSADMKVRKSVRWADSHGGKLTKVFSAHSRYVYDRRPAMYEDRQCDDYFHLNLSSVCVLILIVVAIVASLFFSA